MLKDEFAKASPQRARHAVLKPLAEGLAVLAVAGALGGCKLSPGKAGQHESMVVLEQAEPKGGVIRISALEFGAQECPSSLNGAHFTVQYFNGDSQLEQWIVVPGCADVVADKAGTAYKPAEGGVRMPEPYYYGECDLGGAVEGRGRTDFRAIFVPKPSDGTRPSSAMYTYFSGGDRR